MLHYRFVKNTFGCLSQVPRCLRQCQVSAPGRIKAHRCIGTNSWRVKVCQGSRRKSPGSCFLSAPHLATETCSDYLSVGAEKNNNKKKNISLFALHCLPTQVAWTLIGQRKHMCTDQPWSHFRNIHLQESDWKTGEFSKGIKYNHILELENLEIIKLDQY